MRKIFLPLLLVALSPVAHSEGVQEVEIDAPLSGWHPAEGEDASFSQSINYPASSVNMADDQNISAQIRGKIKNYAAAGKVQQGRLVVNGASMPQRIESDGSFEEFGNESAQTGMLHHQLDPSVEGELHQNTGSTACCRADSTHISHWRFM